MHVWNLRDRIDCLGDRRFAKKIVDGEARMSVISRLRRGEVVAETGITFACRHELFESCSLGQMCPRVSRSRVCTSSESLITLADPKQFAGLRRSRLRTCHSSDSEFRLTLWSQFLFALRSFEQKASKFKLRPGLLGPRVSSAAKAFAHVSSTWTSTALSAY